MDYCPSRHRYVAESQMMLVGIQGQPGSACDEAAALIMPTPDTSFEYLTDADQTLAALEAGSIDRAILAAESPVGTPVSETENALARYPSVVVVDELHREVRHCLMIHPENTGGDVRKVASHPVPLEKHRAFLEQRFPGYEPIILPDPGVAAHTLSTGGLSLDTAVIAMPRAAELFGLQVLQSDLPANDNYLTRFIVVSRAT